MEKNLPHGVESITWKDGSTTYQYQGQEYNSLDEVPVKTSKVLNKIGEKISQNPIVQKVAPALEKFGEYTSLPGEEFTADQVGLSFQKYGLPYSVGQSLGYVLYPGFGELKAPTKGLSALQPAYATVSSGNLLGDVSREMKALNQPLQARVTPGMVRPKAARPVSKQIKGLEGAADWTQGAYEYFIKGLKENKSKPMEGYANFTTPDGRIIRATPGRKGSLTFIDNAKKAASRKSRFVTQEAWKQELQNVLSEFGMSDRYEEMAKIITSGNSKQAKRVTRFNNALKDRGIFDLREHFTVEHIGALKNKWPDVPENRWGIIKRKLNSKAGATSDPPDLNIRMSGTPKDLKEWVIKQELDELDFTKDIPVKVRRQILNATHKKGPLKGKPNVEQIDQIFETYFKSIGE